MCERRKEWKSSSASRPSASRYAAPLGRRALHGFAVAHVDHAVLAELRALWVATEVDDVQHPGFVAPQAERVGGLEQGSVPERRQPPLAGQPTYVGDLLVGVVEERL